MTEQASFIVGIDLGTTHTVVAYCQINEGQKIGSPRIFDVLQLVAPGEIEARPLLPSFRYQPGEGELRKEEMQLPWGAHKGESFVVGELARRLGSKVPSRLIASAKSWLSYPGVDRKAPILPWGASPEVPKISPVEASASYLAHVLCAWNHAHPKDPLELQDVILTIPASFDEGARALTLEAAQKAGLTKVHLLEEPQAAFYDWLGRKGDASDALWDLHLVLVVDVGGGTSDFTLIRVEEGPSGPRLQRIAVGEHLMLGGDNMDLFLAREAESQLGSRLPSSRFQELVQQCRIAKEALFSENPPESLSLTLLGAGSRLVGNAMSIQLKHETVRERLLEGFFPKVPIDAKPERRGRAIVELGLPYAQDPAITKHLAAFLNVHQRLAKEAVGNALIEGRALPDGLLLNGGVFLSRALRERMNEVLLEWRKGEPFRILENPHPELAVARGAVHYGLARRGIGLKVGGGSARSYFIWLGKDPKSPESPEKAICLLPRGVEEGEEVLLKGRSFRLRLGEPVRFRLASSTAQAAYLRPGDLVEIVDEAPVRALWEEQNDVQENNPTIKLERDLVHLLPPIAAVLEEGPASAKKTEVPVSIAAMLTEIGTLEVYCIDQNSGRRWVLELQTRGSDSELVSLAGQRIIQIHPRFVEAKQRIELVFGKSEARIDSKPHKTLRQDLERILGPRHDWSMPLLRELWGALFAGAKHRRRSADHERIWFNLVGFCLRPGFGYPLDDWRVQQLFAIFEQGVQFASEAQNWSEWWILWRRVAGGLNEPQQLQVLRAIEYYLHPPTPRPRPRPPGPRAQGQDDILRLAGALERIPASEKEKVGTWILERLLKHNEKPFAWAVLGRIGARVPLYGSVHTVVSKSVAEEWARILLEIDWTQVEHAALAAVQLARMSGDRNRDIDQSLRAEILRRLEILKSPPSWIQMVREPSPIEAETVQKVLGDSLPPGLMLVE
ncbi:MAG: hsp70 family protein [Sandaracinaceae bacterium]|nr:hsp70 family protein [Sandaracinaceae bacterium]